MHLLRWRPQVGLLRTGRQVVTVPSQWTEPRNEISGAMGQGHGRSEERVFLMEGRWEASRSTWAWADSALF